MNLTDYQNLSATFMDECEILFSNHDIDFGLMSGASL